MRAVWCGIGAFGCNTRTRLVIVNIGDPAVDAAQRSVAAGTSLDLAGADRAGASRRPCSGSACSSSSRSFRPPIASSWRWISTACSPRPTLRCGSKAIRSTSTRCSTHPTGKPRVTVLSIAHLDDRERMFFVSLVLNELVSWMRAQRGTSTLRAMVYIDEMMGFLPPVAVPPSKPPLLTLLKQARAFGLGMTLATQNPVDLDYKALANAGTWFLGRLQTERDKARLLDGLEGAQRRGRPRLRPRDRSTDCSPRWRSARSCCTTCTNEEPVLFKTRWTLSYLRGPLGTRRARAAREPRCDGCSGATPVRAGRTRCASLAAAAPAAPRAPVRAQAPRAPLPPAAPQCTSAARAACRTRRTGSRPRDSPVLRAGRRLALDPGAPWRRARQLRRHQARHRRDARRRGRRRPLSTARSPVDWEHAEPADFRGARSSRDAAARGGVRPAARGRDHAEEVRAVDEGLHAVGRAVAGASSC